MSKYLQPDRSDTAQTSLNATNVVMGAFIPDVCVQRGHSMQNTLLQLFCAYNCVFVVSNSQSVKKKQLGGLTAHLSTWAKESYFSKPRL